MTPETESHPESGFELSAPFARRGEAAPESKSLVRLTQNLSLELFPKVLTFLANLRSVNTRVAYATELSRFAVYLSKRFPEVRRVHELRRDHVILFKVYTEGSGVAPASVLRRLAALSSYFGFLAAETDAGGRPFLEANLFANVLRPRAVNQKETAALEPAQVEKLLSLPDPKTPSGLFHRALLSTLFGTGARNSSIRLIRVGDIAFHQGVRVVRIWTKGGKAEIKPVLPWVWEAVGAYLEYLASAGVTLSADSFVFQPPPKRARAAAAGRALSAQAFGAIFKKYCSEMGLSTSNAFRFTPHSGRATVATTLSRAGAPLPDIQELLGHSSIQTTNLYIKKSRRVVDSAIFKLTYLGIPSDPS